MKRFIRLFSFILSIIVTIAFTGCGNNEEEHTENEEQEQEIVMEINALEEKQNVEKALCGTDALGREISPAGEENGRLVGLFYTLWLGNYYSDDGVSYFGDTIYDMSEMDFNYLYSGGGSPFTRMHYYAKPLFGYYNQHDKWVVERHVQMFIAAGIDFLGIDATNNDYYPTTLEILLETLDEYYQMGYDVPKIMFLTNTDSSARVNEIYDYLYKEDRYSHLWFCDDDEGRNPDKKPWITMKSNEKVYLRNAVRNKFYFRESQWPNESFKDNGFPWIEFTKPQPVHNGVISVSVAQNNGMHMSDSVQYEVSPNGIDYYNKNWGRGYSSSDDKNSKDRILEGSNFEEEWEVAINSDAHIAFVLEWNEWAALKLATTVDGVGSTVVFFDCASVEFSRDIEPITGNYGDNYYMQLIRNVRRFKESKGDGITVDKVDGEIDWNKVTSGVSDFIGQNERNYINVIGSETYTNETKRNDIKEIRVASDDSFVYILVTTKNSILLDNSSHWMNVWIKNNSETAGNCGYNYVINQSRDKENASICKLTKDGSSVIGDAKYNVSGKTIMFAVPISVTGDSFELKVTDNVDLESDIMNLYQYGDSAPYGRLNYMFNLKK